MNREDGIAMKFYVGQKVKITGNTTGHHHEVGDIVELTKAILDEDYWDLGCADWEFDSDDCEPYEASVSKIEMGDIVIRKLKHSCDIRIVEDANEGGILLVNGIKDKYYHSDEFDLFHEEYELLVKKSGRLDSSI